MGPKTLPTIWYTYMTLVTKYQISAIKLLRKMRRKISWTDGRTDRGKIVYPPPPSGSGGKKIIFLQLEIFKCTRSKVEVLHNLYICRHYMKIKGADNQG
jgi:hypothetical protein